MKIFALSLTPHSNSLTINYISSRLYFIPCIVSINIIKATGYAENGT
jgi:hypothetical protein